MEPHAAPIRRDAGRLNDPPTLILASLADGPKHGWALLQDIQEFAGVRLGPGTLYGAISRLEQRGSIEAAEVVGRARPYRLTDAGRQLLEAELASMRTIVEVGSARLASARAPRAIGALA